MTEEKKEEAIYSKNQVRLDTQLARLAFKRSEITSLISELEDRIKKEVIT
ncbi:MAG: hypothetical protein IC227_01625 [Enterococcus lacertideformus]|uniref:Uncharacterized protein n=1 Tax=Enterococcus lacertideformus TaxID=2771493 RepID=A0A931AT42_9ENTE|nr:hypothetical protein [Enterococcus lacertideformus]